MIAAASSWDSEMSLKDCIIVHNLWAILASIFIDRSNYELGETIKTSAGYLAS